MLKSYECRFRLRESIWKGVFMEKRELLYEGKAKKVFKTNDPDLLIVDYKDDATAWNGEKKGTIPGKGAVNNRMTNYIFRILEEKGIPTHYVQELSDRETVVKKVKILPLEVIVRNAAAGSFSKRLAVEEGLELLNPTVEFCYKDDRLGDPLIDASYMPALGIASQTEMNKMVEYALTINEILIPFLEEKKLRLVDFKLEFGRYMDQIILADEISPDTCRLWDTETNDKMDKDRFRQDLGEVEEAYIEVARRLGL